MTDFGTTAMEYADGRAMGGNGRGMDQEILNATKVLFQQTMPNCGDQFLCAANRFWRD